ncbi:general secretion pathway protein D [Desulfonatronum thiosulfatophilum]|uniref:General secretion pathway protein D n=1 Tax=Desulfonatronum thiosulfatophilum TaxID=617002 RepID=A0A1G6E9A3_9BACT|nr:type II secretion system secretin GspD [Desulfonatronum thiosulfatophilum]SDB53973.1 general secretion pathway protein D [Desulfonatronum thiosulfatophilum]
MLTIGAWSRVLCLIVCLAVFPSGLTHAQDRENITGQRMTANLEGITLRDFILFVGQFTGRNIVFREDQIPPIKVSLHSQGPMTELELLAVLERVLASNNLDLVAQGDLYYILQGNLAGEILDPLRAPLDPGEEGELLTTVLRLDPRASGKQVTELLQPFASRFGMVMEIPQARALLLRDTRARVRKMQEVLDAVLAMGGRWNLELLPLHQAQAGETAQKIAQLYEELFSRGHLAETPVILAVEWSNSLLVAGSDEQLEAVRGLLLNLDQIVDSSADMSMYALKNAKAASAAEVLRSLLQGEQAGGGEGRPGRSVVVAADPETNSVLVLAEPRVQRQVESIVAHLDRGLDQVFVEALIVETSLTNSQELGVEWIVGGGGSDGIITGGFLGPSPSSLPPLMTQPLPGATGGPGVPVVPGGFTVGALGNVITFAGRQFSTLGALVSFMKTAHDFNILSTPQIMTLDNAEAEIFVGENRAYMVSEKLDAQNNPIQTFEYRDVGIRLKVTPHINAESSMIRMQVEQEVRNVIATDAANVRPTTRSRTTRTNVQIPDGFTMVISGLMQNDFAQDRRAMPGLSRIPVLGWLFRREGVSAEKRTLMVFLTARIINTMEQAEELTRNRMEGIRDAQIKSQELLQREFWRGGVQHEPDLPEYPAPR